VLVLRTHGPTLRSVPGRVLLWTTVAVAAFSVGAPYLAPFAGIFGFVALPWPLLGATIAIVVGYILATELAKRWFYRRRQR
jgi:Mg2+-importing ATPase